MNLQNKKALNVPKLRFPEFSGEWQKKSLIDICIKILQGGTPDTSKDGYWNGSINWLTPAEMNKKETYFIYSTNRKITEKGLKNCSSNLLPINSVIISTRAPIGHLAINKSKMAINQGCKGLIPQKSTNSIFLFYSLFCFKTSLIDLGAGNIFKELATSSLKNFEIPIAKQSEQRKIADCLTALDEIITKQSQKLNTLKAHKKGLMQNLFPANNKTTPKLRFPEFKGKWQNTKLKKIGHLTRGITYTSSNTSDKGLLVLRSSNIQNNKLMLDNDLVFIDKDCPQKLSLKKGDIAICMSNGNKALVGKNAEYIGNYSKEITIGVFCSFFRPLNSFAKYIFQTYEYTKFISLSVSGGNINNIKNSDLEEFSSSIPQELKEQQKIANCLTSLDEIITTQTQKIVALKTHKKGLMQNLFPQ